MLSYLNVRSRTLLQTGMMEKHCSKGFILVELSAHSLRLFIYSFNLNLYVARCRDMWLVKSLHAGICFFAKVRKKLTLF